MAQVIVRNIENDVKDALKRRAKQHGWSMEEEMRQILRRAVNEPLATQCKLGTSIASRFSGIGLEVPIPELHGQNINPMDFDV